MSFGMILCACRGDAADHNALFTAFALCKAHLSSLRVLQTMAPLPFLPEAEGLRGGFFPWTEDAPASAANPDISRRRAEEAAGLAAALARQAGITIQPDDKDATGSVRSRARLRIRTGTLDAFLPVESRCCDLVVMGYDSRCGAAGSPTAIAIRQSHRPVLLIPRTLGQAYLPTGRPDCVTIAWDDGVYCANAVHGALPLLVTARRVRVVTVVESANDPESRITADFRAYLQSHGLESELCRVVRDGRGTGAALLSVCSRHPADLIVMGGSGRGGPSGSLSADMTDYVLAHARLPLLLSQ